MIQLTVERILPIVDIEDIYIATNQDYRDLVRQQLPDIPEENILMRAGRAQYRPLYRLGAHPHGEEYEDADDDWLIVHPTI